jgi:hypothetical protein
MGAMWRMCHQAGEPLDVDGSSRIRWASSLSSRLQCGVCLESLHAVSEERHVDETDSVVRVESDCFLRSCNGAGLGDVSG